MQTVKYDNLKFLAVTGVLIVALATTLAFTLEQIYISQLVGIPGVLLVLFCSYKSHYKINKKHSSTFKYLIAFVAILAIAITAKHFY